jgi:radical SAM superfamily enzyme YgiQ (UPF0313 family)
LLVGKQQRQSRTYADFFDFIALGDGEELLPEIGMVIEEGKAGGYNREQLLLDLAQIPGVYVPQFYDMAKMPLSILSARMCQSGLCGELLLPCLPIQLG